MARRKRTGRRGLRVGKWINLAFKIMGGTVVSIPAIQAITDSGSNYASIPSRLAYRFTGVTDQGTIDAAQVTRTIATTAGGLFIAWLGGKVSRRF